MSKNTVENIVNKVRDHFELVLLCAQRAKDLFGGARPTLEQNDDKNTVLAIREIEKETISPEELKEELILSNQVNVPIVLDKSEDDDLLAIEREIRGEITADLEEEQGLALDSVMEEVMESTSSDSENSSEE